MTTHTTKPLTIPAAQLAKLHAAIMASATGGTRGVVVAHGAWVERATIGGLEARVAELLGVAAVNVDAVFDEEGAFAGWVVTGRDASDLRFDVTLFPG